MDVGLCDVGGEEEYLKNEQARFSQKDFYSRIAIFTNNFHLWWPGGWYRDIKKDGQKVFDAVDELIRAQGYSNEFVSSVVNQSDSNRKSRLALLAEAYFSLLEQGFSREELRA